MAELTMAYTEEYVLRFQPPGEDLFELRDESSGLPTLVGHFAVFDQWAEIESKREGHFLERIAPSALTKTITENRRNMRVLFQHGQDPHIGEKVLGPIRELRAEAHGAYYEVPLYDTSYNRDLVPGLADNQYGSSFRFKVLQYDYDRNPGRSEYNPKGIPESTITEAKVPEFGPVTFPAYEGASAGLRSATDWWLEQNLLSVIDKLSGERAAALQEPTIVTPSGSRSTQRDYLRPREEKEAWRL